MEQPSDACARELSDELGVHVDVSALSPVGFAVAGRVVLLLYTCAGDGASPVARVHTELKWLACYARASAMPPAGLPQPLRASVWCIVL